MFEIFIFCRNKNIRKLSKNSNRLKIQILVVFNNKLIYSSYVDKIIRRTKMSEVIAIEGGHKLNGTVVVSTKYF